jgi:hypothetical protein
MIKRATYDLLSVALRLAIRLWPLWLFWFVWVFDDWSIVYRARHAGRASFACWLFPA